MSALADGASSGSAGGPAAARTAEHGGAPSAASVPVSIRTLGRDDGPALLAVNRACPLEADFTFRFDREPDFFAWPASVFEEVEYLGACVGDTLAGYCLSGIRTGWTGAGWGRWAYAGDLRVLPGYRGRGIVRRLQGEFFGRLPADVRAGFCIVKRGNLAAQRFAERFRLPPPWTVARAGVFDATSLPLLGGGRGAARAGPCRAARERDLPALARLLGTAWQGRLFAPAVSEEGLARRWRDHGLGRVFVAERGGRPCGVLAWRDEGAVRRTTILRYALRSVPLRAVWALARARHPSVAPLPVPGQALRAATVTHLAAEDDDPAVLRPLVCHAGSALAGTGYHVLQVGAMEGEGVERALKGMLRARFRSDVWVASVPDPARAPDVAGRPPFIDLTVV